MRACLILVSFIFPLEFFSQSNYTDYKYFGLKGKVKSFRQEAFLAKRKGTELKIDNKKSLGYTLNVFNDTGMQVAASCDCIYAGDKRGSEFKYEFEDREHVAMSRFNKDTVLIAKSIIDNISSYESVMKTEYLFESRIEYDTLLLNHQLRDSIKISILIEDENLISKTIYFYEYDSLGVQTREIHQIYIIQNDKFIKSNEIILRFLHLSYDKLENWTEREVVDDKSGRTQAVERREYIYF